MSLLGTSVAAGVAQTALQAQQVARERDARTTESTANARRIRELLEGHMRALEEGDEFESPAQLHIDSQLPDHPSPGYPEDEQDRPDDDRTTDEPAPPPGRPTLYRHVDVQA